ncbi:hypothetical protein ACIBSV_07945 [Embleya sp. NPDC050154]|uniref:hypothetical protein n=1 Tax=unclassified Embleya TaxID=2699296 RepID=UPI0037B980BB
MKSTRSSECPLHGVGVRPEYLVGRRLEQVLASWHLYGAEAPSGPLDVWLLDSEGVATHITTGSDWCLIVETSPPFAAYDMREVGRVEVAPIGGETPFAEHLGETISAIDEQRDPYTGRLALEITFGSGRVRCETWSGDLRLSGS